MVRNINSLDRDQLSPPTSHCVSPSLSLCACLSFNYFIAGAVHPVKGLASSSSSFKKNNNNKNQYMPCAACVFVPQHYFHSSFADRLWCCVIINSPLNCTFLMHILTSSSISSLWPLLDLVPSILLYNGERGCFTGILAKDYFFLIYRFPPWKWALLFHWLFLLHTLTYTFPFTSLMLHIRCILKVTERKFSILTQPTILMITILATNLHF